jgi:hypothetical protein
LNTFQILGKKYFLEPRGNQKSDGELENTAAGKGLKSLISGLICLL